MTTTPVSTPMRAATRPSCARGEVADGDRRQHGPLDRALRRRVPEARRQPVAGFAEDHPAALEDPGPRRPPHRRGERHLVLRVERAAVADDRQLDGDDGHPTPLPLRHARGRRQGERQLVAQDAALELADRRAGLEPELLAEAAAQVLVGVQGVGLSPGAVLRRHQLGGEPLVQRVGLDRLLELGDDLAGPAADLALEQLVHRGEPPLVELHRTGHERRAVPKVEERLAPPLRRARRAAWRPPARRRRRPVLPADRSRTHRRRPASRDGVEAVPGGLAADGVGGSAEGAPQAGHVDLHRLARAGLRPLRPQAVDQLVDRDDPAPPRGEEPEHETLLRASQRHPSAIVDELHRPEYSHFHRLSPYWSPGDAGDPPVGYPSSSP